MNKSIDPINLKFLNTLNESQKRWFVACKAIESGRGGIKLLYKSTGIARSTIIRGIKELQSKALPTFNQLQEKIRREGGGRKKLFYINPAIEKKLVKIMEETTAGDPMSYLKWTCKSTRRIAEELNREGYSISAMSVYRLLKEMGYSLQANVKTKEGKEHPDRDRQFRYINEQVKIFMKSKNPIISVDTKKKENIGEFKNSGQIWRKVGDKKEVLMHDFPSLGKGQAIPYGTYDIQKNKGLVNVGISHDTSEFAVESIRRWWKMIGSKEYPDAKRLLICADSGGSNGVRVTAWKTNLQKFAKEFNIKVTVAHYPPGASKWNKIEHKMFSFISMNWKGEPLISYETVINLISKTTTKSGLKVRALLDTNQYEIGKKISSEEIKRLNIKPHSQYPQWNYTIFP